MAPHREPLNTSEEVLFSWFSVLQTPAFCSNLAAASLLRPSDATEEAVCTKTCFNTECFTSYRRSQLKQALQIDLVWSACRLSCSDLRMVPAVTQALPRATAPWITMITVIVVAAAGAERTVRD